MSLSEIKVRAAKREDAPRIAHVHIKSWQETYRGLMPDSYIDNLESLEGKRRLEFWESNLSNEEGRRSTWVAQKDDALAKEIVGFVSVGRTRDQLPISDGEIYAIYLLKLYHGQGVGRLLFESGITLLKEMEMKSAALWVAKGNKTEGFYRHLGGIPQGERVEKCGGAEAMQGVRYYWSSLRVR